MRINVVGGGPAGLYFALLMKRQDPACEVTIWERDPPGVGAGWGLVFSGAALATFEAADPASYAEIAARLLTWDQVRIVRDDATIGVGGQRFSGIARVTLLRILRSQCEALGVRLRHGVRITDPATLPPADLVVGAGGRSCPVRDALTGAFGTTLDERPNRFIWLGTTRPFDNLNLIFRGSSAGAFCAHAYRYDATMSTFIVECTAQTFERTGLGAQGEENTLRALEQVFAHDLDGHALRTNGAAWDRFRVVCNQRWWADSGGTPVVLLGDALHTAHFSIGSGTALAMESALVLAACLRDERPIPAALQRFQGERAPAIGRYQALGAASMRWFETFEDDLPCDPHEFAMRCMCRSGRIGPEDLRRRDPAFVRAWEQTAR